MTKPTGLLLNDEFRRAINDLANDLKLNAPHSDQTGVSTTKFSLAQQLEEVERELSYRAKVYPNLVRRRQLRESQAEYHMQRMEAVAETLRGLIGQEQAWSAQK